MVRTFIFSGTLSKVARQGGRDFIKEINDVKASKKNWAHFLFGDNY